MSDKDPARTGLRRFICDLYVHVTDDRRFLFLLDQEAPPAPLSMSDWRIVVRGVEAPVDGIPALLARRYHLASEPA